MPLVGSRCENNWSECVPSQECITCAAHPNPARGRCCMTPEILELIFDTTGREGAGISVTMLTGPCLRQSYLQLVKDYYDFPSKRWPAARGTLVHLLMERASPQPHLIRERRFGRKIDSHVLTGKIDKIDLSQGLIQDTKTKETLPNTIEDMPGYVRQINCYRWIVQDGFDTQTGEIVQWDIQHLELVICTMSQTRRYPVPLIPDDQLIAWLAPRLHTLAQASPSRWPEQELNPMTSSLCLGWCAVRDHCLNPPSGTVEKVGAV